MLSSGRCSPGSTGFACGCSVGPSPQQTWHYKCAYPSYGLEDVTTHTTTCKDSVGQQAKNLVWHDPVECPNDKRLVMFSMQHPNDANKPEQPADTV